MGLLIGEDLGEGHARVIVDGDVQGLPTRMFLLTTAAAIAAPNDLLEAVKPLMSRWRRSPGKGCS